MLVSVYVRARMCLCVFMCARTNARVCVCVCEWGFVIFPYYCPTHFLDTVDTSRPLCCFDSQGGALTQLQLATAPVSTIHNGPSCRLSLTHSPCLSVCLSLALALAHAVALALAPSLHLACALEVWVSMGETQRVDAAYVQAASIILSAGTSSQSTPREPMTRSHKSFGAAPKNFFRKPFRVLMGLKALQDEKKQTKV